jgi:hypothetical protein
MWTAWSTTTRTAPGRRPSTLSAWATSGSRISAAGRTASPRPGYDNTSLAAVGHLSLSSADPRSTDIWELASITHPRAD